MRPRKVVMEINLFSRNLSLDIIFWETVAWCFQIKRIITQRFATQTTFELSIKLPDEKEENCQ